MLMAVQKKQLQHPRSEVPKMLGCNLRDFLLQICRALLAQHFPGEHAIAEEVGTIKFA